MGCSPPTILEQVTDGSENKEINSEIEAKGMLRMFPPPYNPIRRIRIFFLILLSRFFGWGRRLSKTMLQACLVRPSEVI